MRAVQCVFILALVITAGCSDGSGLKVSKGNPVSFDTGFPFQSKFMGVFVDTVGVEHVYFAEPMTRKQLKVFSMSGELEWTVPLDSAVGELGEVGGMAVLGFDSIMLCVPNRGRLLYADRHGNLKADHVFRSLLPSDSSMRCENRPPTSGDPIFGDGFLFGADWAFWDLEEELYGGQPEADFLRAYFTKRRTWPLVLKYTPGPNGTGQVTMGPDSFHIQLYGTDTVYRLVDFCMYFHSCDRYFYLSTYSPDMFELDGATMRTMRRVTLRSEQVPICPRPTTSDEMAADDQAYKRCINNYGFQVRLDEDVPSGYFIVQLAHPEGGGDGYAHPFYLLVLDPDLKQIGEHVLAGGEYVLNKALSTRQGLYLQRQTGDPRRITVQVFERFTFE